MHSNKQLLENPENNKYSVIIFDWDGTLMDSIDKIINCVIQAAKLSDILAPSPQAIRDIIGLSLDKAMEILFPMLSPAKQQQLIDAYRHQYTYLNKQNTPFYPGIKAWLKVLKQQGYLLAVATGKGRKGLDRQLLQYEVTDLFSITYCADETLSKPDPLMLNNILEALSINAEQALMIGDSSFDLEMANNANVDCIGVTYGVHSDAVLSQYKPIAILSDLPTQLWKYI
ncbi:HAD-superfamily hydrolase, subfamily IA, variant 3 [Psychromonas ingrahamii 37]|uniref:HAD-superfamily hydrolase, subfamily IA, variant 3 n=1 Tax=Psychromonas ingrahamii (strain DSM 17664 / CCUG 51855 / 37) TaxID=357804 RepID=A1SWT2_PSYIN|nr:HAD-IIIA family hydrolase [Psychromonas ingrahamii]ABM03947.1 HAD-superfamily hydrolase, subfamily IA, variant 3 [Psychromonas ingrahamii 37]